MVKVNLRWIFAHDCRTPFPLSLGVAEIIWLAKFYLISESWYRETMPILKAGIEDKSLRLPKDANILSDFRSLRVVKGVARIPDQRQTDNSGAKRGKRHGDSVIACAMMLDARKELGSEEPWDYHGIPLDGFDLKDWQF